jgi:GNAT superfamily N-acetyltransferase
VLFRPSAKPHLEDACPPVASVEPYRPEHHDGLLKLLQYRYAETGAPFDTSKIDHQLEEMDYEQRHNGGNFVVLTHANKLMGSLAVRRLSERGRAEFDMFYIDPFFEGKGYSAPLYRWAFDWCNRNNIESVELWSGEACTRAHHLYRNLGFVANGVKKLLRSTPKDYFSYYFELNITPALTERLRQRFAKLP